MGAIKCISSYNSYIYIESHIIKDMKRYNNIKPAGCIIPEAEMPVRLSGL